MYTRLPPKTWSPSTSAKLYDPSGFVVTFKPAMEWVLGSTLSLTSFSVNLEVDWLVEEFLLVELLSKNIPISSRASLSSSVHVPFPHAPLNS